MHEVLVPIDFSEESAIALEYGINLANHFKSNLRIIHVKTDSVIIPFYASNKSEYKLDHKLNVWAEELYEKYKSEYHVEGGYFDYKIREGNIVTEICNQAKYDDATVMVLGSHNDNSIGAKWVGSNAYRLVSHSPCPVIVVNKRMDLVHDVRSIVVPVDYKVASRKKVAAATGMAYLLQSKVHVVGLKTSDLKWMNEEMNVFVRQVEQFVSSKAHVEVVSQMLTGSDFPKMLLNYCDENDIDMITVHVHHSNNPFVRLFQSFTNELVNNSLKPVLVIPTKD